MITQIRIEYLSEEKKAKAGVLQKPVVVLVRLEGEEKLVEAIRELLETKYKTR